MPHAVPKNDRKRTYDCLYNDIVTFFKLFYNRLTPKIRIFIKISSFRLK